MSEKINMNDVLPGLYRVFWTIGGSSLAAVGVDADGGRWIAPTNWVFPGRVSECDLDIEGLVAIPAAETRLVPRGVPESVPLTEIMAGVIGGREDAAKSFFNVGVMVSDLHADVRSIKNMILALAETTGDRFGAQSRALGHHSRVAGDIVLMVKDVGEKVEAVLDQVTPRDNAVSCDAAEISALKDELGDVMRERDEWKASSEAWKVSHEKMHRRAQKAEGEVLKLLGESEPVTDESGVSVGAGSFIPKVPGTLRVGIDPAKPGTDKTVIRFHQPEGSFFLHPPAWAGPICDTTIFGGSLIVACQNGVFRLDGDRLTPLRFVAG